MVKGKQKRADAKDRVAAFLEHYLQHFRTKDAAIAAGYSEASADRLGSRLLTRPEVREAVDAALTKRAEKAEIDADWVLVRLIRLVERCMQEEEVLDNRGRPTGIYRFDSKGANRALELIGKHIGMFRDKSIDKQNHLHLHVGPDGRPLLPGTGQLQVMPTLFPAIREVQVNRPVPIVVDPPDKAAR